MPVTVIHKAASNKTKNGPGKPITIVGPIIDKIAIVLPIQNSDDQNGVKQAIMTALQDMQTCSPLHKRGRYRYGVKVHIPATTASAKGNQTLTILAGPYDKKTPYLRVEFNPAKIGPQGMADLRAELNLYTSFGWVDFQEFGYVTRLDVAYNVLGISPHELVVKPGKKRVSWRVLAGRSDGQLHLETSNYGAAGKGVLAIYSMDKHPGHSTPSQVVTRLEYRVDASHPLATLIGLPNPFKAVEVYHPFLAPPSTAGEWLGLFLDSCRIRGFNNALKLIPEHCRAAYKKAAQESAAAWWLPEELWAGWPTMVENSGLLLDDIPAHGLAA